MLLDLRQISFFHPILRAVIMDIEKYAGPLRATSLWRPEKGIHGTLPLRAIDCSCKVESIGMALKKWVNDRWIYDPFRPEKKVLKYHGPPMHIHLQIHPRTRRK